MWERKISKSHLLLIHSIMPMCMKTVKFVNNKCQQRSTQVSLALHREGQVLEADYTANSYV